MATAQEIQSLLKLVDDEHPVVRAAVKERLGELGPDLETLLLVAAPDADPEMLDQALELRREHERDAMRRRWKGWLGEKSTMAKLERGHQLLADYLAVPGEGVGLISEELDRLAIEFAGEFPDATFRELAEFLFESGLFSGASEDYYDPRNSNLGWVLEARCGNPISLASTFVFVGLRCGLEVGGCSYPAHFLARAIDPESGELYLVDCFNDGKIIEAAELIRHHPLASREVSDLVEVAATAEAIMARMLKNLENAFARNGEVLEVAFMKELYGALLERSGRE